jgi:filamentous hemagglutinin family protein
MRFYRQVRWFILFPCLCFFFFCFFMCLPWISSAGVATDGTVGAASSLSGPDYQIPHDLGTTSGQNLFHSFRNFSISQGESATFTGPDSIANVISRVTGGEVSSIDGLLRSQVGQADFFFINPAGVVFGSNAVVDVPAAFHVTTADELQFADGNVFSSLNPHASNLSMADPVSFGYLSPQPASIVLNGTRLEFEPESMVTFAGGNVEVSSMGELQAEGGDIRLVGVGDSPNQMNITDASTETPPLGNVVLDASSIVDVTGSTGPESIVLRGNHIHIINSEIAADHHGSEDSSGKIFFQGEDIRITNGEVHASVFSDGRGNDIHVEAHALEIDATKATDTALGGRSRLTTRVKAGSAGKAGIVDVTIDTLSLVNGGHISSISEPSALGNCGTIHIHVSDDVSIQGSNGDGSYSGCFSTTFSAMGGEWGDLFIDAPNATVTISEGGTLQAGTIGDGNSGSVIINIQDLNVFTEAEITTFTQGAGTGGDITIKANGSIALDNAEIDSSTYGPGQAGNIFFSGKELNLLNGSEILADTLGSGNAGRIWVEIGGAAIMNEKSYIEAATAGVGAGGKVEVKAGAISLLGGSAIFAGSLGDGPGGKVAIDVSETFLIDDYSFVSSGISDSGTGTAGDISIKAATLNIFNTGLITNSTWGDQNAGSIVVEVGELTINGGGTMTGIMCDAQKGVGNGGDIEIAVSNRIELLNGGQITSNTRDKGHAGNLAIETAELLIHGGGNEQSQYTGIFSESRLASGDGGDVQVLVTERGELLNGGQISASALRGEGDGGSVTVEAAELVINGEEHILTTGILSESTGSSGNGGDVRVLITERLEILCNGQISSSTELGAGNAGSVTVEAPEIVIDGKDAGIFSRTSGSLSGDISGNSGEVRVTVTDCLDIGNGGQISASSNMNGGDAGSVIVDTTELTIHGQDSGILCEASWRALGQVGGIHIMSESIWIAEEGAISIFAGQTLFQEIASKPPDARIQVDTGLLHLDQDARITAESTGDAPAAAIELNTGELIVENGSGITTSAKEADGGPITIRGETMVLRDGFVTTSVSGLSGDGGTIVLTGAGAEPADVIVFSGGFVQGNTAAPAAHGGDIVINSRAVIAEENQLTVGGGQRQIFEPGQGLNLIQAAAPGGEQGTIDITAPELDISGSLVQTGVDFFQPARLATDPCSVAAGQGVSSLILGGRGGVPALPGGLLDIDWGEERLDRLLKKERSKQ